MVHCGQRSCVRVLRSGSSGFIVFDLCTTRSPQLFSNGLAHFPFRLLASECTCVRGISSASYRMGRQTRSERTSTSMDSCLRRGAQILQSNRRSHYRQLHSLAVPCLISRCGCLLSPQPRPETELKLLLQQVHKYPSIPASTATDTTLVVRITK